MEDFLSLKDIAGIDKAIELQRQKLETLRGDVKELKFKKIDIAGSYASISYKAIDGGNMRINLNPFEINVISVADSNGRKKLSFVVPEIKGYGDTPEDKKEALKEIVKEIDQKPIIQKFVKILKCLSISEVSYILNK